MNTSTLAEYKTLVEQSLPGARDIAYQSASFIWPQPKLRSRGLLLHGPSGVGKSRLASSLIQYAPKKLWSRIISSSDIFKENIGETEVELHNIFQEARTNQPSLLIFDDIEAIAGARTESKGAIERRVLAQLAFGLDSIHEPPPWQSLLSPSSSSSSAFEPARIFVIGITNRISSIDSSLRRAGRLDCELEIKVPTPAGRHDILSCCLSSIPSIGDLETICRTVSQKTHGFVASDLQNLCREAVFCALRRHQKSPDAVGVECVDFLEALTFCKPASLGERSVFLSSSSLSSESDITKDRIELVGMDEIMKRLDVCLVQPLKARDRFIRMGIRPPRGILLRGSPGTGKTTLAYALARSSGVNFVCVQSTEIISKIVGESEKQLADVFRQARACAPCILFLDQVEALASSRSLDGGDAHVSDRILSTLLIEMDGILSSTGPEASSSSSTDVIVLAATSRPDLLDPAILRPGRLDQHIELPLPNAEARFSILQSKTNKMPLAEDVSLSLLAEQTNGFSGADLENMCREAAMSQLRLNIESKTIAMEHFESARKSVGGAKMFRI